MKSRRPTPHPLLGITLAALVSCQGTASDGTAVTEIAEAQDPSPAIVAEDALAAFDAAWETIRDQHFDTDLNGIDWDAVREELRPRAGAATSDRELRGVIQDMLGKLEQSHFYILPRGITNTSSWDEEDLGGVPEAEEAGPGFDIRARDGKVLVTSVREGGAAEAAGVRPGWVVEAVEGQPVSRLFESAASLKPRELASVVRERVRRRCWGSEGTTVEIEFLDGRGETVELELERARRDVLVSKFGNLPTFYLEISDRILEDGDRRIGYLHFTNWFLPVAKPIDEAVDRMRDCDGFILDLRGNDGGALPLVMGVAGHFFDERQELGSHITRQATLTYRANPRRVNPAGERVSPYAGPLAILIDETSASASEVFAGSLQSVGRARVFGETSMGAVLPARTQALPGGDVLMFAMADYTTPDGTHLEGRGVVPDEVIELDRELLLSNPDPQLEAALRWLAAQTESASKDS